MIARNQMSRQMFAKGTMPARNKKNFRPTKSGAGMTRAGVKAYRRITWIKARWHAASFQEVF